MSLPAVPENLQNIPVVREYLASLVAAVILEQSSNVSMDFLVANFINVDGSTPMAGNLNMGGFRIIDLGDPLVGTDAANKDYVDSVIGSGGGGSGGGGKSLTFIEAIYDLGPQGFNTGTFVDVPTVSFTLDLAMTQTVLFLAAASAGVLTTGSQGNYVGLGISVNGTDYPFGGSGVQGFNTDGGGIVTVSGFTTGLSITPYQLLTLSPGSYIVKLRAVGKCILGSIGAIADFPTKLTAVYLV